MAPPAAPSALTATLQHQYTTLSWTASGTAGVTYTMYRSNCGTFVAIASGLTTTTYNDYEVLSGTVYAYYVVAVKDGETSTASNTVSLTYTGVVSFYQAERISQDARQDRKGAATVAAGVVVNGSGEWVRLQKLRGTYASCGT